MDFIAKNGKFNTVELHNEANNNISKIEECSRKDPGSISRYPIGYVIPLGTLGNAPNQLTQFKSNFHLVAYTLADGLTDKKLDFEDFNYKDASLENGQIAKLGRQLDELVSTYLGEGWYITTFNVKIPVAIESMCKGARDIDSMKNAMEDFIARTKNRLDTLQSSTDENPWQHELIELFYTDIRAVSVEVLKMVEKRSASEENPIGACNSIVIETLVYDDYANGLRLLTNTESFASSKIRRYTSGNDVILYVLKARISGENEEFRPIRQFKGKSQVSSNGTDSGCTERIIYNIVNKNYKHWSFMSIPMSFSVTLKPID